VITKSVFKQALSEKLSDDESLQKWLLNEFERVDTLEREWLDRA
jgi:hypothetical protein